MTSDRSPIKHLAIMTMDRPTDLTACLVSFVAADPNIFSTTITVCDDTRNTNGRNQSIASLAAFAKTTGIKVNYVGRFERLCFVDSLSKAGIDRVIAKYVLLGVDQLNSVGANRNAALLATTGERVLLVDDDTTAKVARHPNLDLNRLDFGHDDPSDVWFLASREETLSAATWVKSSLLSEHGAFLGEPLIGFSKESGILNACHHITGSAINGTGGVRITVSGVVGDSGIFSSSTLLTCRSSKVLQRLLSSDETCRIALASREMIRLARAPAITHGTGCIAMSLGLDNRRLLPPFMPVYRNEDGVFGALLEMCFPHSFIGHIPLGVLHNPANRRTYAHLPWQAQPIRSSELLLLLASLSAVYGFPEERLIQMGSYLRDLGGASETAFTDAATTVIRNACRATIQRLRLYLSEHQGPRSWTVAVQALIRNITETMLNRQCWCPVEFGDGRPVGSAKTVMAFVRTIGIVLQNWHDIIEATRYLKNRGYTLGVNVNKLWVHGQRCC